MKGPTSEPAEPGLYRPYQVKVAAGAAERNALLEAALPDGCRSVLDVGCNLGDVTAHMAGRGLWAVGVDRDPELIEAAFERHGASPGCAFMVMDVGPDELASLPEFDVVLLLSVHHYWLQAHGYEGAREMLRGFVERTRKVLILEGAARRIRYFPFQPGFVDNDEASVTRYLLESLEDWVGDMCGRIEPLGRTRCVGEREPYRYCVGAYR